MLKQIQRSIHFAAAGIYYAITRERNLKIHGFAGLAVVTLGLICDLSSLEWALAVIIISMVISLELLNTAVEYLCDFIHPTKHPAIKQIKDVSAGAVLILSIGAAICGGILFIPKISALL